MTKLAEPTKLQDEKSDTCAAHVLLLEHRRDKMKIELAELQDSNAALLAACTEETNRADKAEAETIEARRRWLALVEEGFAHPGMRLVMKENAGLTKRAEGAEAEVVRLLQLLTPSMASITIGEICGTGEENH